MAEGALETAEGAALASEVVDLLEAELVRFQHRVEHDHGIELDRARAAMVLLGKLVGAGVPWTAKPDSDPVKIQEVFSAQLKKHPAIASILKKEIAGFFVATTDVVVVDDNARTPAAILRRAGADPSLWWWAAGHADPAKCWSASANDVEKSVQCALAFGAPVERVGRALASAFGMLAARVKTRYTAQRSVLAGALTKLAAGTPEDPSVITKLAFEIRWKDPQASDPLAELSIHAFQLVEAMQAAKAKPDVERFGALAGRAERMFATRGLQLDAMVRKELDEPTTAAIAKL